MTHSRKVLLTAFSYALWNLMLEVCYLQLLESKPKFFFFFSFSNSKVGNNYNGELQWWNLFYSSTGAQFLYWCSTFMVMQLLSPIIFLFFDRMVLPYHAMLSFVFLESSSFFVCVCACVLPFFQLQFFFFFGKDLLWMDTTMYGLQILLQPHQ